MKVATLTISLVLCFPAVVQSLADARQRRPPLDYTSKFRANALAPISISPIGYVSSPYKGYPANRLEGATYNYEDVWAFTPHGHGSDLQLAHATKWDGPSGYAQSSSEWTQEWYFNEQTPINTPEAFSVNFLIRSAR